MQGNRAVGFVIGVAFVGLGFYLRHLGASGWPTSEVEDVFGSSGPDPAGGVLEMIGNIWMGVGALLLVLFAVLTIFGSGRRSSAPVATVTYPTVLHQPSVDATTMADGLTRLAELKGRGLLSDDEWQRAKALYLGKQPDHRAGDAQLLEDLYDLHQAGGLSESEFNTKKWEILERS